MWSHIVTYPCVIWVQKLFLYACWCPKRSSWTLFDVLVTKKKVKKFLWAPSAHKFFSLLAFYSIFGLGFTYFFPCLRLSNIVQSLSIIMHFSFSSSSNRLSSLIFRLSIIIDYQTKSITPPRCRRPVLGFLRVQDHLGTQYMSFGDHWGV